MEFFGAFLDQEWEPLSNMFSFEDNDNVFFPIDQNTHFYCASIESSNSNEFDTNCVAAVEDNVGFSLQGTFEPMDFMLPAIFADEVRQLKAETGREEPGNAGDSRKRKFVQEAENYAPDDIPQPPKRIDRVSKEANKTKRDPRSKKSKTISIDNRASTCSSEQGDSNELVNGKSKGGKGPATDSQSIYARKRRERINERLKILQTLVPNGTKVDISTMLEEAVDYVKFLQLQIKLLSSDDTWMYAPIAYNGMDMGLYQKIIPNL